MIYFSLDKLKLYQFYTNTAKHYFCTNCGIHTHNRPRINPKIYGINVACIDDIDVFKFKDVAVKYQEYLKYYGSLTIKNQEENFTEILTNIERYKALVDVLTNYDSNFAKKESITFESYLQLFKHFYQDEPSSQEVTPLTEEDFLKEFDTVLKGE